MSQTDKLLSNIYEYHQLLGFLDAKHPEILKQWKNLSNGPTQATTNDITRGLTTDDRRNNE